MRLHRILARRLRHLFRRDQAEAEMREEMNFHLEQRAADYTAEGVSAADARYAAQRRFGNTGSLEERARDAWGWGWLERAGKDVRFAFRQLTGNPGFTLLAILTLGLGIGANTSMFSVLNAIMLRPLPYPEGERLERLFRATPQTSVGGFSGADYLDFARASEAYGSVAAYTIANASISEPGHSAEMLPGVRQSAGLFTLLGVAPQLGRDFRPEEDAPGRDRVVIINHRVWLNRFGGRPDAIGRTIRIDGEPHEIIGVMPLAFNDWRHLGGYDFYRPLALTREQAADRRSTAIRILGRRAPGRTRAEAGDFVARFGQRLATAFPDVHAEATWRSDPLQVTAFPKAARALLPMLVGLSGFVLLIACSNLANLLLARTMARAREFAVRAALGASRTQLLRPLIAESLLLAFAGGGVAILVAFWFRDWAAARSMDDNGQGVFFPIDGHVAAWTFGAALLTALAFGVAPALFALRLDPNHTLKSGGRGLTGGRGHQIFRQILIIGQFAFAMVLLTGAGLYIRGVYDLTTRRAGWTSDQLVAGTILLPKANYSDAEKITAFHRLVLERIAALPGVASVSLSAYSPFYNWGDLRKFIVEGRERPPPGREPGVVVNRVSPQYFVTVGTRLLSGRAFTEHDSATSAKVFILGQGTARALFGAENPLGRRIAQASSDRLEWGEVVGVVADVESSEDRGTLSALQLYVPMMQDPTPGNELIVRTAGVGTAAVVDQVRSTMTELDPDLPVRKLQSVDAAIYRNNYQLRVLRDILAAMAMLGLALAALGIYGIVSRTMAQRTLEFAIRVALGANLGSLSRMVLASGVKMAFCGATLGLIGAWGVAQLFAFAFPSMRLYGGEVLIVVTGLLVGIALLACWLPARRAGRIDAMAVLRAE